MTETLKRTVVCAFLLLTGAWTHGSAGVAVVAPVVNWSTVSTSNNGSTQQFSTKGANTITSGDLLIGVATYGSSSGSTDHSPTCPTNIGSAMTQLALVAPTSNTSQQTIVCYKIATSIDASGNGIYTFTGTGLGGRYNNVTLTDIGGANASTPIDQSNFACAGCSSDTSTFVTASLPALVTSADVLIGYFTEGRNANMPSTPTSATLPTAQSWSLSPFSNGANTTAVSRSTLSSSAAPGPLSLSLTASDDGNVGIIAVRP